jgi:hypothetical protein
MNAEDQNRTIEKCNILSGTKTEKTKNKKRNKVYLL